MTVSEQLFDVEVNAGVLVVGFRTVHVNDPDRIEELEDGLRDILSAHDQRMILIDFSQIDFVPSRLINSLLLLVKRVRAEGGQVHLCCLKPKVERVFKTMKLDRVFDLYPTREEGLSVMKDLGSHMKLAQFA